MDKAAMLAQIVEEWGMGPVQPDEMTLREMAQAAGISEQSATRYAKRDVAAGKLTMRKGIVNGRQVNVYRKRE